MYNVDRTVFAAVCTLLIATSASGECAVYAVELAGRVVSKEGRPVASATVEIVSAERLIPAASRGLRGKTNRSGAFTLEYTFDSHSGSFGGIDHCDPSPGRLAMRTVLPHGAVQFDEYKIREYASEPIELDAIRFGQPRKINCSVEEYVKSPGIWFTSAMIGLAIFLWKSSRRARAA